MDRNKEEGRPENRYLAARLAVGAAVIILLLIGALAINQKQKEDKNIVLRFGMFAGSNWDVPTGNSYQIIDDAILRFEESHPGVKVEYVSGILKEDYPEWLAEQVLLGTEPDVFMIPSGEFDMLVSADILMELSDRIKSDSNFNSENYYQAAYGYGNIYEKQYALPYECVPTLMFVNKTLLEREGIAMPESTWDWDTFLSICRQVTKDTDGDGTTDQFGCYDYSWRDAACASGVTLFDENGTSSNFGDEQMEKAVMFVKELDSVNQGYSVTSRDFDEGKVAFRPLAFSEYRTYKPYPWRIKKYSEFEWDCVKMPSGSEGKSHTELDTLLMGISSRTNHEKLAWEFIKLLCYEEETQTELLKQSQGLPVVKHAADPLQLKVLLEEDTPGNSKINIDIIGQVMEEAVKTPNFGLYTSAMDMADVEINRMLRGETSMDTGLLKLQREINGVLKK